jgi:mono/diheme cytochrome c family protein
MNIKSFAPLLLVVAFLLGLQKCLYQNPRELNVEFLPEMIHSAAYDAYAPNPNFKDGKTLQPPVEGTIVRGFLPEYSEPGLTEELAGKVLVNAIKLSTEVLTRGSFIFATYCQICHGSTGLGDGPVAKRGVPPPPSLQSEIIKAMPDGQLYFIISNGKGNMPPYRAQIQRDDRWKVIHYIKSLGE